MMFESRKHDSSKYTALYDKIRQGQLHGIAILSILLCGFILRTYQYVFNRSIWLDEAMLALNIVNRSFTGLTQPLDYNQGAPIGFLFIQKLFILVFGNTDYALRAFPFITSLLSLLLIYYVANIYTKGIGKIIVITLFSANSSLIYYASECKQYSSDVMLALLLLFCASKCIASDTRLKNVTTLTLVGCISMWLSHPSLFIISGISLSVLVDIFAKKNQENRKWLLVMLLIWLVNFIVLYSISFSGLASNPLLILYWNEYFMPLPPWKDPSWFSTTFSEVFTYPVGLSILPISSVLVLVGCVTYAMRSWRTAMIIITPLLFTLVASGLKKYPFGDRLLLFAVPFVLLYFAEGTEQVRNFIAKKHLIAALCVCLFIAIAIAVIPVSQAIHNLQYPINKENLRPIVSTLASSLTDDDLIYVYYWAVPAFDYYFRGNSHPWIKGVEMPVNPDGYTEQLNELKAQKKRIWFVFSHYGHVDYEWEMLLQYVAAMKSLKQVHVEEGTFLYLAE